MLKKTLVAAAVTMGLSAGAFADVHLDNETGFDTTIIAKETKQSALDFSTAVEDLELTFDNPVASGSIERELRDDGFLYVGIKNGIGAEFNRSQINSWLTTEDGGQSLPALEVDIDGNTGFDSGSNLLTGLEQVFKFEVLGNGEKRAVYELDGDTLRLELASNVEDLANANTKVHIKTSNATNIFKLYEDRSGGADKVVLTVGAQHNGSFTADPLDTPFVFDQTKTLFTTDLTAGGLGTATALVNTYFENYKLGLQETGDIADSQNADINGVFNFTNKTSNQNIQKEQVRFTVSGDFSGFVIQNDMLMDASGVSTGWEVNADKTKAARYLGDAGITRGQEIETITATLFNYDDPAIGDDGLYALKTPISSGTYSVKAELAQFNRDTGNLFKPVSEIDETASFYPVTDSVEKIIEIDRDGMSFDTITTGSTSSNKIFIRDVSNRLGEQGGKILVTIYEYEGMGANERADATGEVDVDNNNGIKTLVHRKALEQNGDYFTLPSGGAVTLTPEGVAEMAGVDVAEARQARFVFEVQTNMGEVAVRKKDDSGTDIQNGTRNVNRDNGDDGSLVDFTL